jgi:NADH:ubiquinone oxidoreductase subunit F (NADH-binding)/NADH:ubiquinone oxidoreductase subunit E
MSKNLRELSRRKGIENNLFNKMGELAQETGTVSDSDLERLSEEFLIGNANAFGTATFYDFMKPENKGKKAYVCNGSACLCAGTQDQVYEELEEHLDASEIGHMTCLGRCHENGAFHYNGKNYSAKSSIEISQIIKYGLIKHQDNYHVQSCCAETLTGKFDGLDFLKELLEKTLKKSPEECLKEVQDSQIRGRGGAGFPMGIKLKSAKDTPADIRYIVCNADEGDPGAYSDRYLMEQQPYMVLFGMIAAGYAIGSSWGILYIRAEYPDSAIIIQETIDKMLELGLAGENILGSGFDFHFKIIRAQGSYICGEETALLSSIEGQRPEVRIRPPFPAQSGLFGKPTVVNNVETLAALYYIFKTSGKEYAKLGTEKSKGTKLISLDGFFHNPGIYEVEMGTPLDTVINDLGGGFNAPVKAFHTGGPLGGIVPVHKISELSIDFESFANAGFLLGHATIVCIPEDFPMIEYIEHLFEFTAVESCGKCFPCRLGSKRGQELLNKARTDDEYQIDRELFDDLLSTLEQGSLCALGGGLPLPVKNALMYFEDELKAYFK